MKPEFVLDASVTFAWLFSSQADAATEALLDRLRGGAALAPQIWPLEVANVLLVAERRKRIEPAQSARFVTLLQALPIELDPTTGHHATRGALALARAHALSSYDAVYLDLALREGLPLASRDQALVAAASSLGVPTL